MEKKKLERNNLLICKTMKKILYIGAILLGLLSCSKENMPLTEESNDLVFTGVIDKATTKTYVTIDSEKQEAPVHWNLNDEIIVTEEVSGQTAKYIVSSISEEGRATFTKKSGEADLPKGGTYSATYGDVNNQWYDPSNPGSNCPMASNKVTPDATVETSPINFIFYNTCGVFYISATAQKIVQINLSNGSETYSLNINHDNPVTMVAGTDYYMLAVPAGQYNTISFVNDRDRVFTKTYTSAATLQKMSIQTGHLKNLKYTSKDFSEEEEYKGEEPIPLPGIFYVSDTKKVKFAQGNVWCDTTYLPVRWHCESKQTDIIPDGKYNPKHVSHFYNFRDREYVPSKTIYPTTVNFDMGEHFSDGKTWKILTPTEWEYLHNNHDWLVCNISGINGRMFFPQNFVWNESTMGTKPADNKFNTGLDFKTITFDTDKFSALEAGGALFLAAGGQRSYNDVNVSQSNTNGYYFQKKIEEGEKAKCFQFAAWSCYITTQIGDNTACSFRLSKEVK